MQYDPWTWTRRHTVPIRTLGQWAFSVTMEGKIDPPWYRLGSEKFWTVRHLSLKHGRIGEDDSLLCDLVEITPGHYRVAAYSQHLHRPTFQENLTGPLLHL